jgi:hypothetical protein
MGAWSRALSPDQIFLISRYDNKVISSGYIIYISKSMFPSAIKNTTATWKNVNFFTNSDYINYMTSLNLNYVVC